MIDAKIMETDADSLVQEALQIKYDGFRLVQICATRTEDGFELLYSFGKEYQLLCLRVHVKEDAEIMSISNVYAPAFLYENEIQDLFGIPIKLMKLDYKGNLYRTDVKTPFKERGK